MRPDRLHECFLAHRLHDPAGSEHRDPALDPEDRIEGLFRSFHTSRDLDRNENRPEFPGLFEKCIHGVPDHLSRHRVDRRSADRLVESRLCDTADPDAAVDHDLRKETADCMVCSSRLCIRKFRPRVHEDPVRHIIVIPGVLPDCALRPAIPGSFLLQRHANRDAFRGHEFLCFSPGTSEKETHCPLGRKRRAGSRCVAAS